MNVSAVKDIWSAGEEHNEEEDFDLAAAMLSQETTPDDQAVEVFASRVWKTRSAIQKCFEILYTIKVRVTPFILYFR